jgi:hypothetical protein
MIDLIHITIPLPPMSGEDWQRVPGHGKIKIPGNRYRITVKADSMMSDTKAYYLADIQAIKLMNEASLDVLSDRAPDFTNLEPGSSRRDLQFYLGRLKGDNRFCPVGAPVPGQRVPSYMEALFAFLPDFTQATSEWISSEQKRRQSEYLAQQADDKARKDAESQAIRDEQSRKDAAAKADQQRDIDATRARIEADQKRRQQIEKSRVGG